MADDKKPEEPKESKAKAPKSEAKPAPPKSRLCTPDDRAARTGLKRFKLRLDGHPSGPRSQRYAFAPDSDHAIACYCEAEGVDPKEIDGADVKVVVTELAD